jgi:hypothetical protein
MHAINSPFKAVRSVPTPLERSGRDCSNERADLKFDRFRVEMNFIVGRAADRFNHGNAVASLIGHVDMCPVWRHCYTGGT